MSTTAIWKVRPRHLIRSLHSGRCHNNNQKKGAGPYFVLPTAGLRASRMPQQQSPPLPLPLPQIVHYTTTSRGQSSSHQQQKHQQEEEEDDEEENSSFEVGPKNPGLESVIAQGISSLDRTATEVRIKTKKVSSLTSDKGPSHSLKQLSEQHRILEVSTECIEALCQRNPHNPLSIGGEPLTLLHVDVNSTARQAKVYWTLPYSVLMDPRLTPTAYRRLMKQVETTFDGNVLQREVHTRLSFYFPPRLKFYPATPQMLAQVMHEIHHED